MTLLDLLCRLIRFTRIDLGTALFKIKYSNWRYEEEYRWVFLHDDELIGNKLYLTRSA